MEGDIPPGGEASNEDGGYMQPFQLQHLQKVILAGAKFTSTLTNRAKTPPPPELPKSKIPIPSSIYVSGFRSTFLAGLSDKVYRDVEEECDEDEYVGIFTGGNRRRRRRGPRRRGGLRTTDGGGNGPPGILHERSDEGDERRRRSSDELGDSSVELLGPTETLGTDESDGSGELLSGGEGDEDRSKDQRAGSATFNRYPEKRGNKRRSPVKKSKTVGVEEQDPGGEEEREESDRLGVRMKSRRGEKNGKRQGRPPSSRPGKGGDQNKENEDKWQRIEPSRRPRSKTPGSKSPSKSPSGRSPGAGGGGGLQDLKKHLNKSSHGDKKKVQLPPSGKTVDDADKWSRVPAKDKSSRKRPSAKSAASGVSGSSGDEDKRSSKSTDPGKPSHPRTPPPEIDIAGMDPTKLAQIMAEYAVRDSAAGMRLLQLCQGKEWYGVDGHLRYFEKRLRSGLMEDAKPLADLKDDAGWSPLFYAIKENKIPPSERMIELGCDINAMAKDGQYLIHIAAHFCKEETIRFLISKKVDLTVVREKDERNVLHIVCCRTAGNSPQILRRLLAVLPTDKRMEKDLSGKIPIFLALENGLKGACQELLSQMAEEQLSATVGDVKETLLHIATRTGDMETCRVFTDAGADIDAQNGLGQTVLHIASERGDENLCKFFYLCKANPHIMDFEDRTPIFLAAMCGQTQIVDLLADKFKVSVFERAKDGSTLMHIASLHGHPETAIALFRKGVPLQMPNKGGARSIHIAARNGHATMIGKLLEKGEDVDAVTNDNFTALHIAVDAVQPAVVETLLGYGAQVHIKGGKDKETPLHIGARVIGGDKCAQMLLKSGAEPNITMETTLEAPLHVAARHGRLKIIELLLKDGGNPQQKAKDGDTPLHLACKYGHVKVVAALLEHVKTKKSANECTLYINMVTSKGESALHYASRLNAGRVRIAEEDLDGMLKEEVGRNIVKLLLDGGASVSRMSKEGNETAFHYCCREGNNDILVEMLSRLTTVDCQRALNRQTSKGWSPLLIASRRGHTQVVQTLLKFHARVDVFDTEGRSGLHLAAENGYQEICGILLEHRAFINAKSRVGLTALHLAAMKGFTKLCIFLIRTHGAAVDALTLKKQTPLHLAAESGQLEVCRLLMGLIASPDSTDDKGQKPIHLAAQNNHADVIKLFLKHSPQLVNSFTKDGSTCAHLAAMQGSVAVLEELMKFDKQGVINARNRSTDATALQLAAEGGHADLVNTLLDAGASASDENRLGYTAAHLAAKNGHMNVLEALRTAQEDSINLISRKLGMSALHISAFFGQTETVRDLLQFIPATSVTDPPLSVATSFIKDLGTESGLTPLHMAAYSGEENVVRLLLNFEGVQVDAPTVNFGFNPLHLACRGGHTTVVGLLLSRSSELLESKDASGKASLHIAAVNGHKQMVEVLLGQGAEIDAIDKELWTPLICAAQAGHLDVVRLLVESGASPLAKTQKGHSAIWFAAAENNVDALSYLMKKDHDTYGLMEDKDFVYNLTVCGKNIDNEPIDEFVLSSPAPLDVAAKMSYFLVYVSTKEKERAKDLLAASEHCSAMATELLALAAGAETAGKVLGSVDRKGTEFLDVLIECEQKEVIAHTVVQRHLQEIWVGQLVEWADWKLLLVFLACVFVPPVWVTISMPFGPEYNKIPIVKFMSYLTSHIHLMTLMSLTAATPIVPILPIRTNLNPFWFEWMLFAWLGGLLVAEITNPSDKSGLGFTKVAVLLFSYMGIILHGCAIFMDPASLGTVLYLRDQLFGLSILSACVQILDFLSFHYLFGPWAIIIGNLMKDLARFLAVLTIFMVGFSLMMTALNHPLHERRALNPGEKQPTTLTGGMASGVLVTPVDAFEMLFFALFGLNGVDDLKIEILGQPGWTIVFFKMFFGVYLLVTVIVLINLLIAMMSDTYQRIEQQSDIEWKFGLAKLIRNMHRTTATPTPLNLFVDWGTWIHRQVKKARQPKNKLKWEGEGGEPGEEEKRDDKKESKKDGKQLWQQAFKKTMLVNGSADPLRSSLAQMSPGLGMGMGVEGLALSSTLSTGAANRIETVTDWNVIAKKYYTLVGKEIPVDESDGGDKSGSRQGSSSHMGSSMMLVSKQNL